MVIYVGFTSYVVLGIISAVSAKTDNTLYSVPDIQLEALNSGGFRAYIPDNPGIHLFAFHANLNEDITQTDPGKIIGEATAAENGYWIIQFNNTLTTSDRISYWVFVSHNRLGYRKDGNSWFVTLSDTYKTLINNCDKDNTSTTIDGTKATCLGATIFEDYFNGPTINTDLWTVEHRIPTYSEPNYEFNTYENRNETLFFRDGKLFIKPIALTSENDVRGTLNLREGCTADVDIECHYHHASAFLLPPVKSAKIKIKHSFKYGEISIRAKLPAGDWIIPIIELEPKDKGEGPNGPKLLIAFSRGNDHYNGHGTDDIGSRLLFAGPVLHPTEPIRSAKLKKRSSQKRYSDDFHVYGLVWRPGQMSFMFDGSSFDYINTGYGFSDPQLGIGAQWNAADAPFNKEYILSIGVAVGGIHDFPDDYHSPNDPKPWINGERNYIKKFFDARNIWLKTWKGDDTALQIDYVKITAT